MFIAEPEVSMIHQLTSLPDWAGDANPLEVVSRAQ